MQPEALSNLKTYPALQDAINSLTSPQLANITFDQVAAIKGGWDSNSKMAGPLLDMVNLAQATGSLPSAQFPSANNSRVGAVVLQVARSIATSPYASAEQRDYWAQQVVNANNQDPKNAPLTLDSVTQKNIDDYIKNVKFNFQTIRATMLFVSGSLASVPLYQSGGTANNLQATAYLLQFIGPAISGYSKYLNQYEVDMSGGLEQQGFNEVFNVLNLAATAYAISQNDSNTPSSTIATQALSSTSSIMFTISEFPQKSYFSVVDGQFVAKNFKILGYELQPPAWAGAAAANINALGQVIVATNVLVQSIVAYLDLPANTSINLKAAYISTIAFTAAELVALAVAMIYQPELAPMIATVAAFMPSFTGIVAAVDMKRASNDFADTGQSIMSDICEQIYQYLAVSSAPIVGPIGSIFGIPLMGDIVNRMTANNNAQIFMAVNEYEAWVSLNCHDALAAINVIRAGLIALAQSAASISASSQSYDFIAIHTVTFNAQDQYFGNNENLSYASVQDISSVNPASVDVERACAVLEDVRCDGADKRLACNDDWLMGWFQRGAIA